MTSLNRLISRELLKKRAGPTVFARGQTYVNDGAVGRITHKDTKITARIAGSHTYHAELHAEGERLGYGCTCPHAEEGNFCKHCVALGLAWLAQPSEHRTPDESPKPSPDTLIRDYLSCQSTATLAELVLTAAQRDDVFYQSLLLKAERNVGPDHAAPAFRRAIDRATHTGGNFIDWDETHAFSQELAQVVDSLETLLEPHSAAMLIELCEYAIQKIEAAFLTVDDSSGEVSDALPRLSELHLHACEMAPPDPIDLARRLFQIEMSSPFDAFYNAVHTYQTFLGPSGLDTYRRLAQEQWQHIKPIDGTTSERGYNSDRLRITQIMEALATIDGDLEGLVAIKSRDLSSAYCYLTIAELYQNANQPDRALDWAERGLNAFPHKTDNRLRDFLATDHLERGQHDEALQLTWVQFDEYPNLASYQKLHRVANPLGIWPAQRQRALDRLMTLSTYDHTQASHWMRPAAVPDYSLWVEIALWENDVDAAWHTVQQEYVQRRWQIQLANRLEQVSRFADAIALYRRIIPTFVEETKNSAYEDACELIRRVGTLMKARGQTLEFGDYLAELRLSYKAKRNFIKQLDTLWTT